MSYDVYVLLFIPICAAFFLIKPNIAEKSMFVSKSQSDTSWSSVLLSAFAREYDVKKVAKYYQCNRVNTTVLYEI